MNFFTEKIFKYKKIIAMLATASVFTLLIVKHLQLLSF